MSEGPSNRAITDAEDIIEDDERSWIHHVEREETIAPEAVGDEELEEYIEVDGVVCDNDIEGDVVLHSNEVVVSSEMQDGAETYYADNGTTATEEFNMNLPDLLSRHIVFTNGSKLFFCFSKRCRKQLAFEGYLYNIDGYVKPLSWNLWRCANPSCRGTIRTSPNITELRVRDSHSASCRPDDLQIRLRIAVYDLRLMAEFTDLPLETLYRAYLEKVSDEHKDLTHLFPPLDILRDNLEDHRANLIYRKRFAAEAREADSHAIFYDSYGMDGNGAAKFRRTKPFPPAMCLTCGSVFRSTPSVPAQDQLLEHLYFDHNRKNSVINRFTFEDPGLFEQWVRELQYHSKYRLKKMCLHDEHMYYLCQSDVRHFKANHSRATIPDLNCSAFVRVHDWRHIIQGEINEVVVDYCLDHCFHDDDSAEVPPTCKPEDIFTPEVFMRELSIRRERTQQLIQDKSLQRIKRRHQQPSICMKSTQKFRKSNEAERVSPPQHVDYNNGEEHDPHSDEWTSNAESVFGAQHTRQRQKVVRQLHHYASPSKSLIISKESHLASYITKRENFVDTDTYNTVLQFEMSCEMVKERMQYARSIQTANHYLGRLTAILDDVMADPECAPSGAVDDGPRGTYGLSTSADHPAHRCSSSPTTASDAVASGEKSVNVSREVKSVSDESLPLRQKVLVRRGDNGQIVVVKRTMFGKVRRMESSSAPISKDHLSDAHSPQHPRTSLEQIRDGPPVGDLLRDALYSTKAPGYDRAMLQGVRRMAYHSLGGQSGEAEEEAKKFIQRLSSQSAAKDGEEKTHSVRRPRGRPRKWPSETMMSSSPST